MALSNSPPPSYYDPPEDTHCAGCCEENDCPGWERERSIHMFLCRYHLTQHRASMEDGWDD